MEALIIIFTDELQLCEVHYTSENRIGIQDGLSRLKSWAKTSEINFNWGNSKFLHVGNIYTDIRWVAAGLVASHVKKDLGVLIDHKLTMN